MKHDELRRRYGEEAATIYCCVAWITLNAADGLTTWDELARVHGRHANSVRNATMELVRDGLLVTEDGKVRLG